MIRDVASEGAWKKINLGKCMVRSYRVALQYGIATWRWVSHSGTRRFWTKIWKFFFFFIRRGLQRTALQSILSHLTELLVGQGLVQSMCFSLWLPTDCSVNLMQSSSWVQNFRWKREWRLRSPHMTVATGCSYPGTVWTWPQVLASRPGSLAQ